MLRIACEAAAHSQLVMRIVHSYQVLIKHQASADATAPSGTRRMQIPTEYEVTDNCRRFTNRDW
jgi:hypothetical protein